MKNILVTCLKDETNLLQSSHLVTSIAKENPHCEVSILTFSDLESSANLIQDARKVFTIDRFKIEHLKSGSLYSDAFALNTLADSLSEVLDTNWNQVVNFGNDQISAHLIPLLTVEEIAGAHITNYGSVSTSDRWSSYANYYRPSNSETQIEPQTCFHHSAKVPMHHDCARIKMSQDFSMVANQNFARIRASKNGDQGAIIVGINLNESKTGNSFSPETLSDMIETFESSFEYKPVLLTNGSSLEKELVNELNRQFGNNLISVNMDITAAPSVLANLDWLITKPNRICALAEAMDTNIIETIVKGETSRTFKEGSFVIQELNISHTADDIYFLLNQENQTVLPMGIKNSENKVYSRLRDNFGFFKTLIRGPIELKDELNYHISRNYHYALMGYELDDEILKSLHEGTNREELMSYTSQAKEELTECVKTLLATLRSLQSVKQSNKNAPRFLQYMESLMALGKEDILPQAAISLFEASVENITSTDFSKNLEDIEKSLFTLKGDFKILTKIFENLLSEKSEDKRTQEEL